ncbi:MAG: type II secretion system protein GspM [Syntrophotaleaceae bacterium]
MNKFNRLNMREKILVCLGIAFVFLAILYWGGIAPYKNQMANLDRKIAQRQKQVGEMAVLKAEILDLQERVAAAERKVSQAVNFSLFSFVEQKVQEAAGRENLVFMRPKPATRQGDYEETALEVKLEKISLQQVVRLIYEIEAAEVPLNITTLQIRSRKPNMELLDVTLDISTLRKKA